MGRNNRSFTPKGKVKLTTLQLNVRAAVSMKKAIDAVILMAESVGKGPNLTMAQSTDNSSGSLSLLVGWNFDKKLEAQKFYTAGGIPLPGDAPDLILELTPRLGVKKGEVAAREHVIKDFSDAKLRERIGEAMTKIQLQLSDTDEKDVREAIMHPWLDKGGAKE